MTGESFTSLISGGPISTNSYGYSAITVTGDYALTEPTYRIYDITAGTATMVVYLVSANNYSLGQDFVFNNTGVVAWTLKTNTATAAVTIMTATVGGSYLIYLTSKSTADGTWRATNFAGGGAQSGANANITSLSGLTTPLTASQGGTGANLATTAGATHFIKQPTGTGFVSEVITATEVPVFTGDSGAGGIQGAVPAPGVGDAAAKYSLLASGVWGPRSNTVLRRAYGSTASALSITATTVLTVTGTPSATEGVQVLSVTASVASVSNILRITAAVPAMTTTVAAANLSVWIVRATTVIAAAPVTASGIGSMRGVSFNVETTGTSVASHAISIRAAPDTGNTLLINQTSTGGALLAGFPRVTLLVEEIIP